MILLEDFSDLNQWSVDEGISVSDGWVSNSNSDQWLWRELPESINLLSCWRISVRVDIGESGVHIGLSDEERNSYANRIAAGYSVTSNALQLAHASTTSDSLTSAKVIRGIVDISFVCDGETISAVISNIDNEVLAYLGVFKPQSNVTFTHIYIRFFNAGQSSVGKLALKNSWSSYGDEAYEKPLKGVIMTNTPSAGGTGSRGYRALFQAPANLSGKQKLVMLYPGYGGDWSNYASSTYLHYGARLANLGYVSVSLDTLGSNNGNLQSTTHAVLTRNKIMENLPCHFKFFTVGKSMGGFPACNVAIDYPECLAGIVLNNANTNTIWRYYSIYMDSTVDSQARKDSFHTAYNCDERDLFFRMRGRNPQENYHVLAKYPILARYAEDDTQVEPINAIALVSAVNAIGGNATTAVIPTGGHNSTALYDAESDVVFFNGISDSELNKPTYYPTDFSGSIKLS